MEAILARKETGAVILLLDHWVPVCTLLFFFFFFFNNMCPRAPE